MTRLQKGLLIGAVGFVLLIGACSTVFYFRVYQPFGAPMMAMAMSHGMDEQLTTRNFVKPGSGEVTAEQVRRYIAVEEAVEARIAEGRPAFVEQQGVLERAGRNGEITIDSAIASYAAIRPMLMNAKPRQIDAMNKEHFSKKEFDWVREQLYRAAGIPLTRIDVSDLFEGVPEPGIRVRTLSPQEAPPANQALARPIAAKLEAWRAFAFFGL
jgi:hypothetical protein